MLRKFNAIICIIMFALMLVHIIAGAFQALGVMPGGIMWIQNLTWIMVGLMAVHACIGVKLTVDSIRATHRSGAWHGRENRLFLTRRISGFVIAFAIIFHIIIFYSSSDGAYRLNLFEGPQLVLSLLLVAALIVHILCNIKPVLISFGIWGHRFHVSDIMFIIAVILFFCAVAFVVYWLRWNVLWK